MSVGLDDALRNAQRRDVRRAARALLTRPLLRAGGPGGDDFALVRRHAGELRRWFDVNTGWRLLVDAEGSRLIKTTAADTDATHPARDRRSGQPFGRRRYVLTCLALAVLERCDAQVTLGRLAEGVILGAADERLIAAGFSFRLEGRGERGDLVAVVRLLLDLGVLDRVAGDEDAYVRDAGDALYDVQRRALAALLAAPHGPSTIASEGFEARLSELAQEPPTATDELRNRSIRRRLTRRLLDDPVLYYDDLTAEELAYFTNQRGAIVRQITELTGLVAEARAEGVAMVDPDDALTDVRMPEAGTDGHVALLIAGYLSDGPGDVAVPISDLEAQVRHWSGEHRAYWRKAACVAGAEAALVADAVARLEALNLIERVANAVKPRPALARYAVTEPTITDVQAERLL